MWVGESALSELVAMRWMVLLLLLLATVALPNYGRDVRVTASSRVPRMHRRVAADVALAGWARVPGPLCSNFTSDLGF